MREDLLGFASVKKEPKPVPILGAITGRPEKKPSAGNVRLTTRDLMTPAVAPQVSLFWDGEGGTGSTPAPITPFWTKMAGQGAFLLLFDAGMKMFLAPLFGL